MEIEILYKIAKHEAKEKAKLMYPEGHPDIEAVERRITLRIYREFTEDPRRFVR